MTLPLRAHNCTWLSRPGQAAGSHTGSLVGAMLGDGTHVMLGPVSSPSVNGLETREQLRAELTRWLEYWRSEFWRLKNAGAHVTKGELRDALGAYEDALETLSRFVNQLEGHPPPVPF
jgi:hypothetical protein